MLDEPIEEEWGGGEVREGGGEVKIQAEVLVVVQEEEEEEEEREQQQQQLYELYQPTQYYWNL